MVGIRGRKFCRLGSSVLWLVKCIRGEKYTQVFSAVRRGSVYIYIYMRRRWCIARV